MDIKEVLIFLFEKHRTNANQVADAIKKIDPHSKANQPTIHRIETGESRNPRKETLEPIAAYFGITLAQLRGEQPLEGMPEPTNVEGGPRPMLSNMVPVVGTAQLGPDGFWEAMDYPVGYGDGWVRYPTRDPNAYALRVKGDSMRPRIKPGEFVLIEPNTSYGPSNEVMVQTKDGRCMVKTFDFKRGAAIQLSSVNETDFKPITLEMDEVEKIHRVIAIMQSDMYYRDNT